MMYIYKNIAKSSSSSSTSVEPSSSISNRQEENSSTLGKRTASEAITNYDELPIKDFLNQLNEVRLKHNAVAVLLEKGIKPVDQDGQRLTAAKVTKAHVEKLRFSLITQQRSDYLYQMRRLVLQEQYYASHPMFDYTYSTYVTTIIPPQIEAALQKPLPEQFDHIYAITKALTENEYWILDYEDKKPVQKLLHALANSWKKLFANSDEDLGIDGEFTRPGCIAMLNKFSKVLQGAPDALQFKWEL